MNETTGTDRMDLLLYAAMPFAGKKETAEYERAEEVPVSLSEKDKKRILKQIRRAGEYMEWQEAQPVRTRGKAGTGRYTVLRKIGTVILVALASFALLGLSMEEVRTAFGNTVVTWYRHYFQVEVEREKDVSYPLRIVTKQEPRCIPAGISESYRETVRSDELEIGYSDGAGNVRLVYRQSVIRPYSSLWIDENAKITEVMVNGWYGMLFTYDEPGRRKALTWEDGLYQYDLIGLLDQDELILIAESVAVAEGEQP